MYSRTLQHHNNFKHISTIPDHPNKSKPPIHTVYMLGVRISYREAPPSLDRTCSANNNTTTHSSSSVVIRLCIFTSSFIMSWLARNSLSSAMVPLHGPGYVTVVHYRTGQSFHQIQAIVWPCFQKCQTTFSFSWKHVVCWFSNIFATGDWNSLYKRGRVL